MIKSLRDLDGPPFWSPCWSCPRWFIAHNLSTCLQWKQSSWEVHVSFQWLKNSISDYLSKATNFSIEKSKLNPTLPICKRSCYCYSTVYQELSLWTASKCIWFWLFLFLFFFFQIGLLSRERGKPRSTTVLKPTTCLPLLCDHFRKVKHPSFYTTGQKPDRKIDELKWKKLKSICPHVFFPYHLFFEKSRDFWGKILSTQLLTVCFEQVGKNAWDR